MSIEYLSTYTPNPILTITIDGEARYISIPLECTSTN